MINTQFAEASYAAFTRSKTANQLLAASFRTRHHFVKAKKNPTRNGSAAGSRLGPQRRLLLLRREPTEIYSHFGVQDVGLAFLPKLRVCTMLPDTSVGSVGFKFEALACRTVDVESLPVYSVCACLYDCAGVLVHAHGHDEIKQVLGK